MIGVRVENDLVVIDLVQRRFSVLLSCAQAEEFERALGVAARQALLGTPTIAKGERWGVTIKSFDGGVGFRFQPPHVGAPTLVRVPPATAVAMAQQVRFCIQQAKHKMRFEFKG